MALLPIYKDEMLFDGSYIHALPFCLKNCKNDKCLAHYRNMISKTTGFYTCPYGLSTFVYNVSCDTTFIFSGLRERSTYRKKQAAIAQSDNRVFNPVLDAEELVSLAKNECEYQQEKFGLSQKMEEVNELLHEARKLNGQIKTECDIIWENSASGTEYSVLLIECPLTGNASFRPIISSNCIKDTSSKRSANDLAIKVARFK